MTASRIEGLPWGPVALDGGTLSLDHAAGSWPDVAWPAQQRAAAAPYDSPAANLGLLQQTLELLARLQGGGWRAALDSRPDDPREPKANALQSWAWAAKHAGHGAAVVSHGGQEIRAAEAVAVVAADLRQSLAAVMPVPPISAVEDAPGRAPGRAPGLRSSLVTLREAAEAALAARVGQ
jgi:hypothetical protein